MDVPGVDELFALQPEEFTAARDALARRLRAEGDRDAARAVAKLRRPTVPAWAVNQLVRSEPQMLDELLAAGADVGKAQRRALSGVRDTGLRAAAARRRDLIRHLADAADRLLADAGRDPAAHRQEVIATLEAGSASPESAEDLRAGRLSRPLEPAGFDGLSGLALVADAAPPAGEEADPETEAEGSDDAAAARRLADLRAAVTHAQERAEQAAAELAAARRRATRQEREAEARRTEADRLRREAEAADRRADEARRSAAAAAEAVADAEHAVRRRTRDVDAAGAALDAAGETGLT